MIRVELKDFLMNGTFGPVQLGMSPSEVVTEIGQTEISSPISMKDKRPGILKYGFIELFFGKSQRLYMIFSDDFHSEGREANIEIIRGQITRDLTIEKAINLLHSWDCHFDEFQDPMNDDSRILRLESGVELGICLCDSDSSQKGVYGYWLKNESLR